MRLRRSLGAKTLLAAVCLFVWWRCESLAAWLQAAVAGCSFRLQFRAIFTAQHASQPNRSGTFILMECVHHMTAKHAPSLSEVKLVMFILKGFLVQRGETQATIS